MFLCFGAFLIVILAPSAQNVPSTPSQSLIAPGPRYPTNLHSGLSEGIGNFSIEILYHTSKSQPKHENLILSPMTIWTVLAVVAEGATDNTLLQLKKVARLGDPLYTRKQFGEIFKWLTVNTSTVQLSRVNTIFLDLDSQLERDFKQAASNFYATRVTEVDFKQKEKTASQINQVVSQATHGRIPKLVEGSYFDSTKMIVTSALYFKGQWTALFKASATEQKNFYDSTGKSIGKVNMMYNRFTYPFANVKELQARVIELPYGIENRLSMLIMLPNQNVSLDSMFRNFYNVNLDKVFNELRISKDEYSDDEVDCFLPRFKIESNIELNNALMDMGVIDLFDQSKASLYELARTPMYVSKVIHKAEIEVTEEGTTASAVTAAEFANRISVVRFEANRPFAYMIVEKVTNSIVFGGLYQVPVLF